MLRLFSIGVVAVTACTITDTENATAQTVNNPVCERGQSAWTEFAQRDQQTIVNASTAYDFTNLQGQSGSSRAEVTIKKLGDQVLISRDQGSNVEVFGTDQSFRVEKQGNGNYILRGAVIPSPNWSDLLRKGAKELAKPELDIRNSYLGGLRLIQAPYYPLQTNGELHHVFPEETIWRREENIDWQGMPAVQYVFEAPQGKAFNSPANGKIILDPAHNMRWLLFEYDENVDGKRVGIRRQTFIYGDEDSNEYEWVREFLYVRDGESRHGTREVAKVLKTKEKPDPREFTPEFYGIVLVDRPATTRGLWVTLVVAGVATLLLAAALYFRRTRQA